MATKSPCDSGLDPLNAKDTMGPSRWLQRGLRMGWCCTRPASASGGCTGAGGERACPEQRRPKVPAEDGTSGNGLLSEGSGEKRGHCHFSFSVI